MTSETARPPRRAIFREEGLELFVDVLEDREEQRGKHKFRVVRFVTRHVERSHPFCTDPELGEENEVTQALDAGCWGGMWDLEYADE